MLTFLNFISSTQGFQGFGFGDGGFQMSFGIGAFPFGIFATAFNINDGRPPPGKPTSLRNQEGILVTLPESSLEFSSI
jgi:hypothetical protein